MTTVIITRDGTEYTGEIVSTLDTFVEVCYEAIGIEHYGWVARSALIAHGNRAAPWYDLDGSGVDWTITKDLDNLETWE